MSPMDHLMNQAASLQKRTGWTAAGVASFGAAASVRCRIEPRNYEVRDKQNQVVRIIAHGFFQPETDIEANDRLTHNGRSYRVVETEVYPLVTGAADHVEAKLSEEA